VTCSIGAVIIDPEVELTEAYHTADQRLYHVKHHGRNGTSIAAQPAP
jgi:GGDEF domain-containing protein